MPGQIKFRKAGHRAGRRRTGYKGETDADGRAEQQSPDRACATRPATMHPVPASHTGCRRSDIRHQRVHPGEMPRPGTTWHGPGYSGPRPARRFAARRAAGTASGPTEPSVTRSSLNPKCRHITIRKKKDLQQDWAGNLTELQPRRGEPRTIPGHPSRDGADCAGRKADGTDRLEL